MLIERDGKIYLQSTVTKVDNTKIDANKLFYEVNNVYSKILKATNRKFITPKQFGYSLQLLKNRFSGNYVSPSFFKSYSTNPALCLMSQFFSDKDDKHIQLGNTFHKIMEEFYTELPEARTREKLIEIINQNQREDVSSDELRDLIYGYFGKEDYFGNKVDYSIPCDVEKKITDTIHIKKYDEMLPIKFTVILDRIDFREDGIYLIDYKTSRKSDNGNDYENGYLSSMLLGKWIAEQLYHKEVKGVYLSYPRAEKNKWVKIEDTEENEKMVIEKIKAFNTNFKKALRTNLFEYTDKGYFNSQDTIKFQKIMNNSLVWNKEIPVEICLGNKEECIIFY